jgi:hypothetical protein
MWYIERGSTYTQGYHLIFIYIEKHHQMSRLGNIPFLHKFLEGIQLQRLG